jgi:hypothetical protein
MPSFVVDLETLSENDAPELGEVITDVQVQSGFIDELKRTFTNRLDSEDELTTNFELSRVYQQSWAEDGNEEIIKENIISLSKQLHPVQKTEKGLLFHSTDSEVLVAHYHASEGWVKDSNELISGDRVDKDSVISMFALEPSADGGDSAVDADYYTESTTFMQIFGVLSDDVLREIPEREVYINGNPLYDDRYTVRYSFGRDQCLAMIENGSLSLNSDSNSFLIEKSFEGEPHMLEYNFEGGWFGLTRSEDVSKFERDVIQFKHGWLTASRIYRNLVGNETAYTEHSSRVELSESIIQKFEEETDNGDVVFAKDNDEGVISQEFADDILRAVVGTEHYRLYFASHQTVSECKNLRLESEDHSLVFSNIKADSIEEADSILQVLYDQASEEDLRRSRRYLTAAGLLAGISYASDDTASDSLAGIVRQSSFRGIEGFIQDQLDAGESVEGFRGSLNALFDDIGTETSTADLVDGEFDYDSFSRLVEMIDEAGEGLGLSAGDLSELDEEGYRSVITVGLDQRIDGNLTREAETGRGPSDIRLRNDEGEVIYIGECKYWNKSNSGVKSNLEKPLEQLATYDQGETFNSIIIFFESDDFQEIDIRRVWEKIHERLDKLEREFELEDEMNDTPYSRIYRRPDGGPDDRFLSIHVIDVSAQQHHQVSAETVS